MSVENDVRWLQDDHRKLRDEVTRLKKLLDDMRSGVHREIKKIEARLGGLEKSAGR